MRGGFAHHMHYRTFKRERFGRDVVMLCPFAHRKIIHGFLSGGRIPQQQDSFPNAAQRAVHFWCRLPRLLQWVVLAVAAIGVVDWLQYKLFVRWQPADG